MDPDLTALPAPPATPDPAVPVEHVPGWGSIGSVALGAVVAFLSPFYAAVDFADGHHGIGWALVAFAVAGVGGVVAGVRLRHAGVVGASAVIAFAALCAVVGVGLVTQELHRKSGLLLGASGVALPMFVVFEKGWLSAGDRAPAAEVDGPRFSGG